MQDEGGALDVAQELVAKAPALAGTLDEARDVRNDKRCARPRADHAEVGRQCREGVVGDLGARGGEARNERTLAHGRHADEGGVRHELHLELDPVLVGGLPLLCEGGGATN